MDLDQQANTLRVLWKSGRDKYASFFTVLEEVRQEIGNDALPSWCFHSLRIGLSVITEARKVLVKADADIVKRNLTAANAIERTEARRKKEEAALAREQEKLAALKKIQAVKAEIEEIRVNKTKSKSDSASKRRKRTAATLTADLSSATGYDLAASFNEAEVLCQHGLNEWIEGSIAKAIILAAARAKFPADQAFSGWCEIFKIDLHKNDRAALIGLGSLGEPQLRELLNTTNSRSYQLIWRQHRPEFKVIETAVS